MGGAERDRDLQTNLITSLQNGITLLASELLTSLKVSEKEQGSGILKRERVGMGRGDAVLKSWRKFETCHIHFRHCSYQDVWFTPEYSGERERKSWGRKAVRIRDREKVAKESMEVTKSRRSG